MDKLREITAQHKALALMVENEEMTINDVKDTFEALEGELSIKAESLLCVIGDMDQYVDAAGKEIKRLQERKKAVENKQKALRDYLKFNMKNSGIQKIECPLFTISLVKGREMAVIDDESLLDDVYVTVDTIIKTDNKKILADLKTGSVSGAHIERGEPSVRIK